MVLVATFGGAVCVRMSSHAPTHASAVAPGRSSRRPISGSKRPSLFSLRFRALPKKQRFRVCYTNLSVVWYGGVY